MVTEENEIIKEWSHLVNTRQQKNYGLAIY